jgi:hypothetical protein
MGGERASRSSFYAESRIGMGMADGASACANQAFSHSPALCDASKADVLIKTIFVIPSFVDF